MGHFWAPFRVLGATYNVHLRLIGKCIVNFLLVLIERFCYMLRLRCYEQISTENQRFRSNRVSLTQSFSEKGSPATNYSSSQKTRIIFNGIKIWAELASVLSQIMCLTDVSFLVARPRCMQWMQHGKNIKWWTGYIRGSKYEEVCYKLGARSYC